MTMPKRHQKRRTAGSRLPVGVKTVSRPSTFANPFLTADAFRDWLLTGRIDWAQTTDWAHYWKDWHYEMRREEILEQLPTLRGLDLACWCRLDQPCHADVLIELANERTALAGEVS